MSNDWKKNVNNSFNKFNNYSSNSKVQKVADKNNSKSINSMPIKKSLNNSNRISNASNTQQQRKDVLKLQEIEHLYKVWQGFEKHTPEAAFIYQKLLTAAYDYYKLTGDLPDEFLPKNVDLAMLIQMYHQAHKDAFNIQVQLDMHNYVLGATKVLKTLQLIPKNKSDIAASQYNQLRNGFNQQLQSLLINGFALDIMVYEQRIRPIWLVIKQARKLSADNFKPLVKVLDNYSRLQLKNGQHVLYHADKEHTPKSAKKADQENQRQADNSSKKDNHANRLQLSESKDGNLMVKLPKKH